MSCFKHKDYIMPSGKIIKIQGYENKALDILLKKYDESDIIIGIKNINNEIGRITYLYENVYHIYLPDIYIKSTNTIIEVKSNWTYNYQVEKNELKKQACLNNNLNFEFMIL